jgi:hypothetical protein
VRFHALDAVGASVRARIGQESKDGRLIGIFGRIGPIVQKKVSASLLGSVTVYSGGTEVRSGA